MTYNTGKISWDTRKPRKRFNLNDETPEEYLKRIGTMKRRTPREQELFEEDWWSMD